MGAGGSSIRSQARRAPVVELLMPGYSSKAIADLPGLHEDLPGIVIVRREQLEAVMRAELAPLEVDELTDDVLDATLGCLRDIALASVDEMLIDRTQRATSSISSLTQVIAETIGFRRAAMERMRRARTDEENLAEVLTGHASRVVAAAPVNDPASLTAPGGAHALPLTMPAVPEVVAATLPVGWVAGAASTSPASAAPGDGQQPAEPAPDGPGGSGTDGGGGASEVPNLDDVRHARGGIGQ